MTDLIIGSAMTIFFMALLVFGFRTGTMPSIVLTVDAAHKHEARGWFTAFAVVYGLGMIVGLVVLARALAGLSD